MHEKSGLQIKLSVHLQRTALSARSCISNLSTNLVKKHGLGARVHFRKSVNVIEGLFCNQNPFHEQKGKVGQIGD
jgi:hypothetical protein